MDPKIFLEEQSLKNFPSGLGGCKSENQSFECCEYNITIFDNKTEDDLIIEYENELVKVHHGSLSETNSNVLIQYHNLQIILDEQWELRMLLSKIVILYSQHSKLWCSPLQPPNPDGKLFRDCSSKKIFGSIKKINLYFL